MRLVRALLPPSPWRRAPEKPGPDSEELRRAIADLQELTREVTALARELQDGDAAPMTARPRLRVVNRRSAGD
jgi:hypothetical protein